MTLRTRGGPVARARRLGTALLWVSASFPALTQAGRSFDTGVSLKF
jgi:hypothetical protein